MDFSFFKKWQPSGRGGNNYKKITTPNPDNLELAEFLGILLGDGTYNHRRIIEISVGLNNESYKDYIVNLIFETFNINPKVYVYENGYKIHIDSIQLREFLLFLGLNKEIREAKTIPNSIFSMSSEQMCSYIKGFFDTDGHCNGKVISFSNKSLNALKDLQLILSTLCIRSKLHHIDNKYNNIYLLNIVDSDSRINFKNKIGSSDFNKLKNLDLICEKKYSCGWSTVPLNIVNEIKDALVKKSNNGHSYIRSYYQYNLLNQLQEASKDSKNKSLNNYFNLLNNYWFAKIIEIEEDVCDVYDIEVSSVSHFEANGILVHNSPCYAFLLNSNSEVDNLTVIAHAYAHNDFFKNNFWFSNTNSNMMNEMANHGIRIRTYCRKYGRDKVIRFLDLAISIRFLIDSDNVFEKSVMEDYIFEDKISTEEPRKITVESGHEYMDDFINPDEFIKSERIRIQKEFRNKENKFPNKPSRDIIGFVARNSPRVRQWMRDILFMVREETLYLVPQVQTKIFNEGWASFWDEQIMANEGKAGPEGIIEYSDHHSKVLGGKYSMNPYKIGYSLVNYIKDKWDKGRFGEEWDECKDMRKRKLWDKKLGLGLQKIFEIRKTHTDYMLIDEFMDQDFCDKYEFYIWQKNEENEYVLISRDIKDIKFRLLQDTGMNSFPVIKVKNANFLNLGHLLLEHTWTGRTLNFKYTTEVIKFLCRLWGKPAVLTTYDVHEQYNPDIPFEFNDKIVKIALYSRNGESVNRGTLEEYVSEFIPSDTVDEVPVDEVPAP